MNRNFGQLKSNVGNRVQDTSTALSLLIGSYINDTYQELLDRYSFLAPIRTDYTLSVTGGTQEYVLPDDFGKALKVLDTTNGLELDEIDIQQAITTNQVNYNTSGEVTNYLIKEDNVNTDPTSASVFTITSSSASDTTQIIYVRGIVSGREDTDSATLNGTGSVSGTKSFDRILSVSKSTTTTGSVTVTTNSGAVTVSVMAPGAIISRYKKIFLMKIPTGSLTLRIPYIYRSLPMSLDTDYPIIDCDEILEYGATAEALRYKKQFAKAADYERMFEERLNDLVWKYEASPNRVHRTSPQPYSRNLT